MACAKDIMSSELATLAPTTTLGDAIKIFVDRQVSGAPVVDGDRIVGVISELGAFDVLFDPTLRNAPVREFMTTPVRTVDENESLGHLAHMFALYGIRRLPVVRDGRLVGIVTRRDLLKFALTLDGALPEPLQELFPTCKDASSSWCSHDLAIH